ncbi:MAG: TetR/AcrR family transcriptional regulator [Kineosporiaceae bacterium]
MAEYAGRGDATRTMELLWRTGPRPGRGPRPSLDPEVIVTAAIEIADSEGLGAVSMRRVAERLGRSAMTLYSYIPGKGELLDLMLDRVLADHPREFDTGRGWRPAVEAAARASWDFQLRHPWVLQVAGGRAPLGPTGLDVYEAALRLFAGSGLTAEETVRAWGAVTSFVQGAARAVADARVAERETGVSDDDWWLARRPILTEMMDAVPDRYPTLGRLSVEGAFDQADRAPGDDTSYLEREALDAFEFGLRLLLDGIEATVARRAPAPPP